MADLSSQSDEQLIARFARTGDQSALAELARRHEQSLLGLACGVLGGRRELAVDAVQETWMRVIRFGSSFTGRCSFKTWLYRIAINQCRNILKRAKSQGQNELTVNEAIEKSAAERLAERVETNHRLQRAVGELNEDRRMVLLLCYHRDMTHELAAEILEIPLGTLKSRLHAALTQLREILAVEIEA